jgi:hypothetical protein
LYPEGMPNPHIVAEIQALRLQLLHFASHQQNPAVQFHCLAVDSNLAEALERDDPMLREVLASSVEQLEKALRGAGGANESGDTPTSEHGTTPNPVAGVIRSIVVAFGG